MATQHAPYLISADQFLAMEFASDEKVELDNGVIRMMGGGTAAHARIQANVIIALGAKLKGSGFRPYGSDMPLRTERRSIRFPDVTVYCNDPASPANDGKRLLDHARVVFEVLSPSTASNDQVIKLAEYRAINSIETVVFIDPDGERIRAVGRDGEGEWLSTGADLALPALNIMLLHAEIFARD